MNPLQPKAKDRSDKARAKVKLIVEFKVGERAFTEEGYVDLQDFLVGGQGVNQAFHVMKSQLAAKVMTAKLEGEESTSDDPANDPEGEEPAPETVSAPASDEIPVAPAE